MVPPAVTPTDGAMIAPVRTGAALSTMTVRDAVVTLSATSVAVSDQAAGPSTTVEAAVWDAPRGA